MGRISHQYFGLARSRSASTAFRAFSVCLLMGWIVGCAEWSPRAELDNGPSGLPTPRLSPDSVVVETVLVRFPMHSEPQLAGIWQLVDETILDIKQRQRLDRNGLRAGLMISELPKLIRDQLQATGEEQSTNALEHAGLAADTDNKMRQLQCRAGRRKELLVRREVQEPLNVLTTLDGEHLSGETFHRATTLFDLRAIPHGDGSATIELVPEIQHGEHRQSFVSTDSGYRQELKRQQQVWKELAVKMRLKRGQILVMAGTLPPKALGKAFFVTQTADHSQEHVVLLLRLAETQLDELFAPELIEQAKALAER